MRDEWNYDAIGKPITEWITANFPQDQHNASRVIEYYCAHPEIPDGDYMRAYQEAIVGQGDLDPYHKEADDANRRRAAESGQQAFNVPTTPVETPPSDDGEITILPE